MAVEIDLALPTLRLFPGLGFRQNGGEELRRSNPGEGGRGGRVLLDRFPGVMFLLHTCSGKVFLDVGSPMTVEVDLGVDPRMRLFRGEAGIIRKGCVIKSVGEGIAGVGHPL